MFAQLTELTLNRRAMMFAVLLATIAMMALGVGDAAACNSTGGGDFPC